LVVEPGAFLFSSLCNLEKSSPGTPEPPEGVYKLYRGSFELIILFMGDSPIENSLAPAFVVLEGAFDWLKALLRTPKLCLGLVPERSEFVGLGAIMLLLFISASIY
jgi:hypothetical protein